MDTQIYRDKIKFVRRGKGLTQQAMADRLGYNDVKEYNRIETGERRLTLELLEDIASVFEMTVLALLSFDDKTVFNHCTQNHVFGSNNTYHEANASLVTELKEHIAELKGEVAYLRKKLDGLLEVRQ